MTKYTTNVMTMPVIVLLIIILLLLLTSQEFAMECQVFHHGQKQYRCTKQNHGICPGCADARKQEQQDHNIV